MTAESPAWDTAGQDEPAAHEPQQQPVIMTEPVPDKAELNAQLEYCSRCRLIGQGALCAAEVPWPSPSAAQYLMQSCKQTITSGGIKPMHGTRR